MKLNSCNTLAIALLLCIGIFFCACYSGTKPDPENREKFQVTNPRLLDTTYTNEYVR
jgi:hypothetical protein